MHIILHLTSIETSKEESEKRRTLMQKIDIVHGIKTHKKLFGMNCQKLNDSK
jgi:hypothetical protein